jgi:glycosyltransferase involved in cell wall biosynthesis
VKILVLTPTFLPIVGGAEMVLFEVYRRLARRHEIRLVTPVLPATLASDQADEEWEGVVPFDVERYEDRWSFMRIRGHRWTAGAIPPFSLSAIGAVRRAARAFQPDVLNVHYLMPTGLAGVYAERWLGIPTVMTLNGRDAPGPGVPRLWRWWQRALLAVVTDATYVSGYCRTAVYGNGIARGAVVYNGVEIPPPKGNGAATRKMLGLDEHAPLIFALQRLAPEKRVDVLVHALARCHALGVPATLVIGGRGPEEHAMRALAASLGLTSHVRLVGYVPRDAVAGYFDACDVFALHSTFETFGIVVAQAMSYGRPVVTARNTALPEIVGEAGLAVETGDARAFGEALARLLANESLRRRLGEAGQRRAAALFDWDRVAEQYERVLERAATRRR